MAAGTPVLTYVLDGIPNEYYKYCYFIENEGEKELADKITEILSKSEDELKQKSEDALSFLKKEKIASKQVAKIIDFLKD